ncbi:MAG: hypothetical protein U0T82_01850 [Bacteroidales bacterium]
MKRILLIPCILLLSGNMQAQKKSTLKDEEISGKIEWQVNIKNGVEVKMKEAEYKYDKDGNIVMEKTWDSEGKLKDYFEYTYDSEGNELSQTTYNDKKQVIKKEVYTYKGQLKTEKKTYGPNGNLVSRKIYEYSKF